MVIEKVRDHGGQNHDRLEDFVLVKLVYILWLWKTMEGNYGVGSEAVGVGVCAELNHREKERNSSCYPSNILFIIANRPCSHEPSC